MTSLFEPKQTPPFQIDDRPCVWVCHDDDLWYDAVLWGWSWDPQERTHWGYADFFVRGKHHMRLVRQDRIRRHEDGYPG